MNENSSPLGTPPQQPSLTPPLPPRTAPVKPFDPEGRGLMELVLKSPAHATRRLCDDEQAVKNSGRLFGLALLAMAAFGLVMGLFGGYQQLWVSPVKVVGGLCFSLLLCFPSFYIFLSLSGADLRWRQVFGLLSGFTALGALVLIGLLPVAWVFTVSTESAGFMGGLYLVCWILALWFGINFLCRSFTNGSPLNLGFVKLWWCIFLLVSMQMSTTLRPLLGRSEHLIQTEKMFFLDHWMQTLESAHAPSDTPEAAVGSDWNRNGSVP